MLPPRHLNECLCTVNQKKKKKTATRSHFLSRLSTIWKARLTTEMACKPACVQKQPIFLIKTFFWVPGKRKYICEYRIYSVEHMEPCGVTYDLTSYVTSSPRSASVMRILEIFSQGPWRTRVTSGCSSSRSRVLSVRSQRGKPNNQDVLVASRNSTAVKMIPHPQTRGPYKEQTRQIYSPPSKIPVEITSTLHQDATLVRVNEHGCLP